MKMTKEEAKKVMQAIRDEGDFQYTFEFYSGFEEIDCDRFHQLRQDYLDAGKDLRKYLEEIGEEKLHG